MSFASNHFAQHAGPDPVPLREEITRLRAELVKMGRDHTVRLQVRDEEENRLRAELVVSELAGRVVTARMDKAEAAIARARALCDQWDALPESLQRQICRTWTTEVRAALGGADRD